MFGFLAQLQAFSGNTVIDWFPRHTAFLEREFFGNSAADYIFALVALFAFLGAFKILQVIILGRLKRLAQKTETDIDDTFIKIVRSLRPPFYSFLSFYLAIQLLTLGTFFKQAVEIILIIWVVYQAITAVQILIDYVVRRRLYGEDDQSAQSAVQLLNIIAKIALWSLGLLFVLSNAGVNVTSLIAGLGIGGIAVAFALQNILGDLFSSFAIYFDKPFAPGDFIIVGDKMGVVQKVGIKTTRVKALQGEELVFSNTYLTGATVQNYKKMDERRIVFSVGVTYDTPTEKLKKGVRIIKDVIEELEGVRLDRVHFSKFADFYLSLEAVYYVTNSDYNQYMDLNQEIHLAIKERFEKEGIEFAFPTQTIHLEKQ